MTELTGYFTIEPHPHLYRTAPTLPTTIAQMYKSF